MTGALRWGCRGDWTRGVADSTVSIGYHGDCWAMSQQEIGFMPTRWLFGSDHSSDLAGPERHHGSPGCCGLWVVVGVGVVSLVCARRTLFGSDTAFPTSSHQGELPVVGCLESAPREVREQNFHSPAKNTQSIAFGDQLSARISWIHVARCWSRTYRMTLSSSRASLPPASCRSLG